MKNDPACEFNSSSLTKDEELVIESISELFLDTELQDYDYDQIIKTLANSLRV